MDKQIILMGLRVNFDAHIVDPITDLSVSGSISATPVYVLYLKF